MFSFFVGHQKSMSCHDQNVYLFSRFDVEASGHWRHFQDKNLSSAILARTLSVNAGAVFVRVVRFASDDVALSVVASWLKFA